MIRAPLAVVAALALCAPRVAHAEMDANARTHFLAGHAHFAAGRFSDALAEYQAAYKIDPDPDILFAIAQSERKLGQCHLALPHFREYLASRTDFPVQVQGPIAECWIQLPPPDRVTGVPTAPVTEDPGLPWYKNPVTGFVLVGAVSAIVGTSFLIASGASRDQAADAQFSDQFDALLDQATGERRIGATLLISGAVLAAGGLTYHFVTKARSPRRIAAVSTDGHSILFARSF